MSGEDGSQRDSSAMDDDPVGVRPVRKRSGGSRDPNSLEAAAKRRQMLRLTDPDDEEGDGDPTRGEEEDEDEDDVAGFSIRSNLRVELEHERKKPREKNAQNCWWLNVASASGASTAHRPNIGGDGAGGQMQGTPYMTRRSKQVRVKAVLGNRLLFLIVHGNNVRDGVRQMEAAGMLHVDGAHADTRYQMLAFDDDR